MPTSAPWQQLSRLSPTIHFFELCLPSLLSSGYLKMQWSAFLPACLPYLRTGEQTNRQTDINAHVLDLLAYFARWLDCSLARLLTRSLARSLARLLVFLLTCFHTCIDHLLRNVDMQHIMMMPRAVRFLNFA